MTGTPATSPTIREVGRALREGTTTAVELVSSVLEAIAQRNRSLNAFITVTGDQARRAAGAADALFAAGVDLGPLQGIPVSVKDNVDVAGVATTAASRVLLDAPPAEADAACVGRLRKAGAVIIGKTNLSEFAFGDRDEDSPFGRVDNPWREGFQAGTSSSGAGAATAAGLGWLSVGTDTGGSIRHPAAVCGVVGLKPTFGAIAVDGVIPNSPTLDHVGCLARSVEDAALGFEVLSGRALGSDIRSDRERSLAGLRLGVSDDLGGSLADPALPDILRTAIDRLRDAGMEERSVEWDAFVSAPAILATIAAVDLCTYHERYAARGELYGQHFRLRTAPGREVSAVEYARTVAAKAALTERSRELFGSIDVLLLPANLQGAPPHHVSHRRVDGVDHPVRMINSRFDKFANVNGFPALTVPAGRTVDGMPLGVQLVAPPDHEERLFAVASAIEQRP